MFDAKEKSFEYAAAASKLLITLATGMIAFTVTFTKEFGGKPSSWVEALILLLAWVVLLVSALYGVATLLALTGELDPPKKVEGHEASIRDPKVKGNFRKQIVTFIVGVVLIILYGAIQVISGAVSPPPQCLDPCAKPSPAPTVATLPSPVPTATVGATPSPTISPTPISSPSPTPRRCRMRSRRLRAFQGSSLLTLAFSPSTHGRGLGERAQL